MTSLLFTRVIRDHYCSHNQKNSYKLHVLNSSKWANEITATQNRDGAPSKFGKQLTRLLIYFSKTSGRGALIPWRSSPIFAAYHHPLRKANQLEENVGQQWPFKRPKHGRKHVRFKQHPARRFNRRGATASEASLQEWRHERLKYNFISARDSLPQIQCQSHWSMVLDDSSSLMWRRFDPDAAGKMNCGSGSRRCGRRKPQSSRPW